MVINPYIKKAMTHDIVTNTLHQILGIFPEPEIPIMIHDDQRNVSGNGEFQIWGQIFKYEECDVIGYASFNTLSASL